MNKSSNTPWVMECTPKELKKIILLAYSYMQQELYLAKEEGEPLFVDMVNMSFDTLDYSFYLLQQNKNLTYNERGSLRLAMKLK